MTRTGPDHCPGVLRLHQAADGSLSPRARVRRAYQAGIEARAVLEERAPRPRASDPLALPNRVYVVLRASRLSSPRATRSAGTYRQWVRGEGEVRRGPQSLSHGFPSEAEALAYCQGAGRSGLPTWE